MNIVILAAGMGKRMHSDLPKVLHPLAGKPLLGHVIDTARSLRPARLVVVFGHGGDKVQSAFATQSDLRWALQAPQLGTGHAVSQAVPHLDDGSPTLVLYGDVPLVSAETLQRLVAAARPPTGGAAAAASGSAETSGNAAASSSAVAGGSTPTGGSTAAGAAGERVAMLTQILPDPTGYGRIVRDGAGRVSRIVEQKDADAETLKIREINTGILVAPTARLKRWLAGLSNDNAQREYYLTDVIAAAVRDGVAVETVQPRFDWEPLGVNSKTQLAELERRHQRQLADALTDAGVTLADPARIDIRGRLDCGRDVAIDVGCVFEGTVTLGDGARIGPNCVIRDCAIAAGAEILAMSHLDGARVGVRSKVGPFARLRPGTELGEDNHVGNFVEFKNAKMATGSKANHLSYVGDAVVGARVNIGAGTITCNYDGAYKHQTIIEDDVFVGSDTQLVAPVTVKRGATLGAGTTLTREAPADALTISRAPQKTIEGWKRPVKKR